MKQIKKFLKEEKTFILILIISFIIFNFPLPYYISAPGGVIDIENRITLDGKAPNTKGSLNMLYVTEYNGTVGSIAIAKILKDWDIDKIETKQIADEPEDEIKARNKLLLNESIQNATFVAYTHANKEIKINNKKNVILATTDIYKGELMVGDEVISVDDQKIEDINSLKKIINTKETGDKVKFVIKRLDQEKIIFAEVQELKGNKIIGIVLYTIYDYDLNPDINISFKKSESGSSGGLMMALSIYNAISDTDIIKGKHIAGTGTISMDGTVGEIDGIKYKIMGAYKNKMDVVLVPKDNYKEAQKVNKENNYNLKIISINTFEEAIKYLEDN